MADFKDLSDALTDEVLSDMADSFFGARIDVDEGLELYEKVSGQLAEKVIQIYRNCALLEKICLNRANYDDFWLSAGVDRELFIVPEGIESEKLEHKPSFSFSARGEYTKWFGLAYGMLARSIEDYMHGSYTSDANGRKVRSVNRDDLFRMVKDINEKIEKVNTNVSPSDVLKFTKSLDPVEMEKENIVGCVGPGCKAIDDSLAFKAIEIDDGRFPEFPVLPEPKQISSYITEFCSVVYAADKEQVKALLKKLKGSVE